MAGRFPETTSATDNNGRTPLHYAATLKDNGHFYNLLNHLGANPKVEDNVSALFAQFIIKKSICVGCAAVEIEVLREVARDRFSGEIISLRSKSIHNIVMIMCLF